MAESLIQHPSEYVRAVSDSAWENFVGLRGALLATGPLDSTTCELILISGFAINGHEDSFKLHSRKLLESNVPLAAIKQAVLVTLGATAVIFEVARAMQWIDELEQERSTT